MSNRRVQLVDQIAFHEAARAGRAAHTGVRRSSGQVVRTPVDESRCVRFVFSDGGVDRMGDTVDPNGWETREFMRNPVALWAHDSSQPPIGRALAVWSDGQRLLGDIEFMPAETYDFADLVFRLVVGGWLNAVSVGFLPLEYRFAEDDDRPWGIDFLRQSLLEISVCPVPANSNALIEARAKGIISRAADLRRLSAVDGDDDRRRRVAIARARRAQLDGPRSCVATGDTEDDRRDQARAIRDRIFGAARDVPIGDDATRAELLRRAQAVRGSLGLPRRVDPRIEVAAAAHRLRAWG